MFPSRGIIQNMSHYTILYDCFRSPVTDALLRVLGFMTYLLYKYYTHFIEKYFTIYHRNR